MNETVSHHGHEQIELLLPWFVNGTLRAGEAERVAAHIEVCDECRENVELLRQVQVGVQHGWPTPITQARVDDLIAKIDASGAGRSSMAPWAGYVVAASLTAVLVLGSLTLGHMFPELQPNQRFETATSEATMERLDYVIAIEFEAGTPVDRRQQLLNDIGAVNIRPNANGDAHRVVIEVAAGSLDELERYTLKIETHEDVRSVSVVALQLPLR